MQCCYITQLHSLWFIHKAYLGPGVHTKTKKNLCTSPEGGKTQESRNKAQTSTELPIHRVKKWKCASLPALPLPSTLSPPAFHFLTGFMHAHVPAGMCGCVSAAVLRGSTAALDVDMPVFRACKPVLQMRLPIWMGQELAERRRGCASFMVQCSLSVWVRRRETGKALLARHCRAPCCPRPALHSIHKSVLGYQQRAGLTLQSHAFSSSQNPSLMPQKC